jgi:drug/metabolite transporter (DMT)-like permease
MTPYSLMFLALVLIGTTAGQLLFKAASIRAEGDGVAGHWRSLMADGFIWIAIIIYIVEFFIWMAFLSLVPLWQGVMVACADIVLVMIGGRFFFGEEITGARILAISLIAAGVLLVGLGGGE